MEQNPEFTDEQLRNIASDPTITPADIRKLTPGELQRFGPIYTQVKSGPRAGDPAQAQGPGRWQQATTTMTDFSTGAMKGAGETATTLGRGVNAIPGVGHVTNALGNMLGGQYAKSQYGDESVSPPVSDLGGAYEYTKPANPMEKAGKISEQIGEYLIPGGSASRAGGETALNLMGKLPLGNLPNMAFRAATKYGPMAGRAAGEAGSAASVAGLHGEAKPELEAMPAAAIPLVTSVVESLIPFAGKMAPILLGGTAGSLVGGTGGMVGGLTLGALVRNATKIPPAAVQTLQTLWRTYGPAILRMPIGGLEQSRNKPGDVERQLQQLTGGR